MSARRTSAASSRHLTDMTTPDDRLVLIQRMIVQCRAGIWDLMEGIQKLEATAARQPPRKRPTKRAATH